MSVLNCPIEFHVIERIHLWSSYRKYQPFPLLLYFPWFCGCTIICCRFHIYPWKAGLCFLITVQSYDVRKWSSTLWYDGRIRLFAHCTTWLASLCRCCWRYWTSKMLVRYILSIVCLRFSQFSQSFFMNIWGCVYSSYSFLLWWLWEYVYFIFSSPSNRCLGLGHETMFCGMSFCILT